MTGNISEYVRSGYAYLEPRAILQSPLSVLLGVSEMASQALLTLNISTVFDLATSQVFNNALVLTRTAESGNTLFGRFGAVTRDVIDDGARGGSVGTFSNRPIAVLQGIGPNNGPDITSALLVSTVRDLALWPPFRAAKDILQRVLAPEDSEEFDREAPPDLLPQSSEYPTEKVFYSSIVIDEIEGVPSRDLDSPVDVVSLGDDVGFQKPATGAIITMEQAWYAQGVTLGSLLHSVALAPGESTRIAMVDWSRRVTGRTTEDTTQTESLDASSEHNRSISEVTSAVATEAQNGFSTSIAGSASQQSAVGTYGTNIVFGGAVGASTSASGSIATTVSGSFGRRDLAGAMTQDANDRTQQHANASRNRRASVIQEVVQTEQEQITTRAITNYNHMHALSIQYYEVVQIYRISTSVSKVEKCLFVPMKVIQTWTPELIRRYLDVILRATPESRFRRELQQGTDLAEVVPLGSDPPPNHPNREATAVLQGRLDAARTATGKLVASDSADTWKLPTETRLAGFTADGGVHFGVGNLASIILSLRDGSTREFSRDANTLLSVDIDEPIGLGDVVTITVVVIDVNRGTTQIRDIYRRIWKQHQLRLTLRLRYGGILFEHKLLRQAGDNYQQYLQETRAPEFDDEGGEGYKMVVTLPVVRIDPRGIGVTNDVIRHLEANAARYSQMVWMSMDSASLSLALSRYTYRGHPLLQQITPVPVAVTGNYVAFRMNVDESDKEWQNWLTDHGFNHPDTARHETVPLPTGGVFGEAVLGRFNAAEKLDMTRFWNWKDSPIPITAPDVAAIRAGGHHTDDAPSTGQLDAPVIQQVQPTNLPDPQGLVAIISALATSNMFRDMSATAQTVGLAQAALQAAVQGATAAGQQAGANLATGAQLQAEALKAVAPLFAGAMGIPMAGMGSGGASNISQQGALLNHAARLDQATGNSTTATGGSAPLNTQPRPAGSSGGGAVLSSLSNSGRGSSEGYLQVDTFRRLTDPLSGVVDLMGGVVAASNTQGLVDSFTQTFSEAEIKLRVFIPSEIISFGPNAFDGDGRAFSYDAGTSRASCIVHVSLDPSRQTPLLDQIDAQWGMTKKYADSDVEPVPGAPAWFYRRKPDAIPLETARLARTLENLHATVVRGDRETVVVSLHVAGANPLIPGSPDINAEIRVFLHQARADLPALISIQGTHDGFPAYELYVNKVRVYSYDPVASDDSPMALFPPMDREVALQWMLLPLPTI